MYHYDFVKNRKLGQFNDTSIRKLLEIKPLKILHPFQPRLLSLEAVVNRLLDLFESLYNIVIAKIILDNLNNKTEIYFMFLKYILGIINSINKMFQNETKFICTNNIFFKINCAKMCIKLN